MKTLFLIRHAKSCWDNPELSDHDRPLNRRGTKSIPIMSERIEQQGWQVERIFSSTAVRALTTAHGLADSIGKTGEVEALAKLYTFNDEVLLKFLRQHSGDEESLALVGHNPAMECLLERLVPDAVPEKFPTCTIARIQLQIDHWHQIKPGSGRLEGFEFPKKKTEQNQ